MVFPNFHFQDHEEVTAYLLSREVSHAIDT